MALGRSLLLAFLVAFLLTFGLAPIAGTSVDVAQAGEAPPPPQEIICGRSNPAFTLAAYVARCASGPYACERFAGMPDNAAYQSELREHRFSLELLERGGPFTLFLPTQAALARAMPDPSFSIYRAECGTTLARVMGKGAWPTSELTRFTGFIPALAATVNEQSRSDPNNLERNVDALRRVGPLEYEAVSAGRARRVTAAELDSGGVSDRLPLALFVEGGPSQILVGRYEVDGADRDENTWSQPQAAVVDTLQFRNGLIHITDCVFEIVGCPTTRP